MINKETAEVAVLQNQSEFKKFLKVELVSMEEKLATLRARRQELAKKVINKCRQMIKEGFVIAEKLQVIKNREIRKGIEALIKADNTEASSQETIGIRADIKGDDACRGDEMSNLSYSRSLSSRSNQGDNSSTTSALDNGDDNAPSPGRNDMKSRLENTNRVHAPKNIEIALLKLQKRQYASLKASISKSISSNSKKSESSILIHNNSIDFDSDAVWRVDKTDVHTMSTSLRKLVRDNNPSLNNSYTTLDPTSSAPLLDTQQRSQMQLNPSKSLPQLQKSFSMLYKR